MNYPLDRVSREKLAAKRGAEQRRAKAAPAVDLQIVFGSSVENR